MNAELAVKNRLVGWICIFFWNVPLPVDLNVFHMGWNKAVFAYDSMIQTRQYGTIWRQPPWTLRTRREGVAWAHQTAREWNGVDRSDRTIVDTYGYLQHPTSITGNWPCRSDRHVGHVDWNDVSITNSWHDSPYMNTCSKPPYATPGFHMYCPFTTLSLL